MGCAWTPKIRRLISGELNARATSDALDHVRTCDVCREALESASQTAPTAARAPGDVPYRRYSVEEVEASRQVGNPGKKRGWLALAMVAVLTTTAVVSADKDRKPGTADAACREAVEAGRPWAVSPFGEGPRPRQIRAVLPTGASSFAVRISCSGEVVWEGRFAVGDPSVEIYDTSGGTGDDRFDAVAAIAPFPSSASAPLVGGLEYELRILLGDGQAASEPNRFSLTNE